MVLTAKSLTRFGILMTAFFLMLSPIAANISASTPTADPPPVVQEPAPPPAPEPPAAPEPPVAPPPPVEPPPVDPEPPVEPPPPDPEPTEPAPPVDPEPPVAPPPTEPEPTDPEPTESTSDDEESDDQDTDDEIVEDTASTPEAEPTPTEEVIVPDELALVSSNTITISPGEYKDVVVRYTLGSDREKTEMSANLTAPGGESLDDWSLVPWQRADLDEDPQDANRHLKARIDYADTVENGDVYETTWRVTAPNHIEEPVTVRLHLSSKIHREDGVTEGVIKRDLVAFNAVASEHNPTLTCDEVIAEDVDNTWNCAFDTTHPEDDVVITASADVPAGWELSLNDVQLSSDDIALDPAVVGAGAFTLEAEYPIGCPDAGATFSSTLSLSMTYPSGEVSTVGSNFSLIFERPNPTFNISSFEFDDLDLRESLSTTGRLTVSYSDAPCAWQANVELTDLESDLFTIPKQAIVIQTVIGLPNATFTLNEGLISIAAPEADQEISGGEFTIHFAIELPFEIPPGAYHIGVTTQFGWLDQT